jgi:hypothetical protein
MTPDQLAKTTEHSQQVAFFAWCAVAERRGWRIADDPRAYTAEARSIPLADLPMPELRWIHAIHNQGHGDAIRGGKAKAEGVKAGIADIFLPYPFWGFHGLYIEMKRDTGSYADIKPEQTDFKHYCEDMGYSWRCALGWQQARLYLLQYLQVPLPIG